MECGGNGVKPKINKQEYTLYKCDEGIWTFEFNMLFLSSNCEIDMIGSGKGYIVWAWNRMMIMRL